MARSGTLTSTSLGAALAATGQTATVVAIASPGDKDARRGTTACVVIVATSVTSGATFQVERQRSVGQPWEIVARFEITTNGSYGVSTRNDSVPDGQSNVRVNCVAYTDGSYACTLQTMVAA